MSKNRWPNWMTLVVILGGVAILIGGMLGPSSTSPDDSGVSTSLASTSTMLSAVSPLATATPPETAAPINPTLTPAAPAPTPTTAPPVTSELAFNGDLAYQHVLAQIQIGPRPTGSEAGWATGDFIMAELEKAGWQVESQEFVFKGVTGRNVIGKLGRGPIIILGAHYDTRPAADKDPDPAQQSEWIEGANDGASGVAVLLELARALDPDRLKNEIWLAFFDAEDRGRLEEWPFSVGARHMAENLTVNPQSVVVVDMVGDADQQLFFEQNSTEALRNEVWAVAAELGYEAYFIPQPKYTIIDDHLPFLERGIPAIDIIDFDYPYWHTVADTADKVSPASLERVGRTLEAWLEEKQ